MFPNGHTRRPGPATMRASVVRGRPDGPAVTVERWPVPVVRPGWVLVRVVRAALNRLDRMTVDERAGLATPAVIGSDAAGVVVDVAPGVDPHLIGRHVVLLPSLWWGGDDAVQSRDMEILGSPTQGTHAEFVTVPAENLFAKPARLTWEEAAALPLAGLTAWRALVTRGGLRPGQTVVVTAASSGVGSMATQIAAGAGAHVVAVSSSLRKLEQARRLGAARGVLRGGPDYADALDDACPGGADLVVDATGADWPALTRALRPGGRLVALGKRAGEIATLPVQTLYWRHLDVLGSSMGSPRDFAALLDAVETQSWTPVVDSVHPLDDAPAAYDRLDSPDRFGKVVLAAAEP